MWSWGQVFFIYNTCCLLEGWHSQSEPQQLSGFPNWAAWEVSLQVCFIFCVTLHFYFHYKVKTQNNTSHHQQRTGQKFAVCGTVPIFTLWYMDCVQLWCCWGKGHEPPQRESSPVLLLLFSNFFFTSVYAHCSSLCEPLDFLMWIFKVQCVLVVGRKRKGRGEVPLFLFPQIFPNF